MPPPSSSAWPASASPVARFAGSAVGAPSSCCPPPSPPDKTLTFSAGARRDPPPRHHCPSRCRSPATSARLASSCAAQPHPTFSPSGRAPPIFIPVFTALATPAHTAQLPFHHRLSAWASQNTRLNLTFPNSRLARLRAAVQSNKVYLAPPAPVRLTSFGAASDKRCSLGIRNQHFRYSS